ncbi:hypothetical protein [Agarivorans sp. DSG3-1]|uniref:hypothetical protein n=1 Tax=Agarivorans sp. DSG3-1 TaxID=3342249 RepID=UPI00398E38A4
MLRKLLLLIVVISLIAAWVSADLTRAIFEASAFVAVIAMLLCSFSVKRNKQSR